MKTGMRGLNDVQSDFANQLSGLSMIRKRLDYFYAGDFKFSVESAAGTGTNVRLSVPITEHE
ncbi:hypothetical protein [Paenibacillus spongiae]|uniref:Sensor histidine kinase n=1 Tax=Paenibacillus spongiae TaxID=2909671 RepID=A0ABY5SGX1_9BACL|nr:hypothetical protein [Paenibacillus spongiae]UVI33236.1 hypothetical protein L1F29_15940 [Paenibacillus spongiae]